jgi:hypothetical protein
VEAAILNNVLVGNLNLVEGLGKGDGNVRLDRADLVAAAEYDFRLKPGVAAIDAGVDPGEANGLALRPDREYAHPAGGRPRPTVGALDAGAVEYQP